MNAGTNHPSLDTTDPQRYRAGRRVTLVSVATNLLLALLQIVVGAIGHSQALIADGIHTLSDLATDAMVLFALKHGHKAADTEHPYGHGRIETAVTMLLGIMLLAVALGIAGRAAWRWAAEVPFVTPAVLTLWIAALTIAAKEMLYRYTISVARRYGSNMLRANAWHHRSDAISSVIVFIGIAGSLYGFGYLDALAAIIVGLMVAKIGVDLAWQALRELVDTGLPKEDLRPIRETILSVDGVKALHMLRTRQVGGQALVDVHIIVDEKLSVSEGHQVSERVRERLIKEIDPVADVMVHIDTEEDQDNDSTDYAQLPLRQEILRRLKEYFRAIPEAGRIERTTLHYRRGRIDVEIILPIDSVAHGKHAELRRRLRQAVAEDPDIGNLELYFH